MQKDASINYNVISRIYDTGRAVHPETTEKIVRLLNIHSNSILLDLGCGTGNYTWAIHQHAKHITGLDLSFGMLAQARVKYPEITFLHGDVIDLPFRSGIFSGALAIQVLHHVKEKEHFLRETFRVLREHARIVLHVCSHRQMQAFWFYHYFPKGFQIDQARIPDSQTIVSLLQQTGFREVGVEICYQDVVVADETPQRYLEKNYRDSISTFAFLNEKDINMGCKKIGKDIASGEIEGIVQRSEYEIENCTGGSCIIYGRKYT